MKNRDFGDFEYGVFKVIKLIYIYIYIWLFTMVLCSSSDFDKSGTADEKITKP